MTVRRLAIGCVLLTGCSQQDSDFTLHEVSGVVTKSGRPMAGVGVSLLPSGSETEAPALGAITDDDGRFCVRTGTGDQGAPVGDYRIILSSVPTYDYARPQRARVGPIPRQFTDADTTPLSFTVTSEAENRLQIDVE